MTEYYTGIGSRKAPARAMELATGIATDMAYQCFTLRSGGADGMDTAFEDGCQGNAEIYLPWIGFNDRIDDNVLALSDLSPKKVALAERMASEIHPAWALVRQGARKLHTRNIFQVLGHDLKTPSKFVICWAKPEGSAVAGGTRTAVVLARDYGIPVINLYNE